MPEPLPNPEEEVAFDERRFLYPAEIAVLFWKLQKPHNDEQQRIAGQQLDATTKANTALFLLTGDGKNKGQLERILDELADGKRRDLRISRKVRKNEQKLEQYHAENKLARGQDRLEHERAMRLLRKEIRSIRRNQLWVVRKFRGFYDWCTARNDKGRYSRPKMFAFAATLVGAEEGIRHYAPMVWHKTVVVAHALRM